MPARQQEPSGRVVKLGVEPVIAGMAGVAGGLQLLMLSDANADFPAAAATPAQVESNSASRRVRTIRVEDSDMSTSLFTLSRSSDNF